MSNQKTPNLQTLIESLDEGIRKRAYQLFEERGGEHGHDIEDWLRAESQITGEMPVVGRKKIAVETKSKVAAA